MQQPQISAKSTKQNRIQDTFASLYDEGSTGSETSQDPTPTTDAPSKQHIDEALQSLHDSIKIVAVTDCPVHIARSFCSCAAGLASLAPSAINHYKVNIFQTQFDALLLGGCKPAFNYAGEWDLASHRTFTETVGKTPQQFVRGFLQQMPIKEHFDPRVMLNDTVQAMIDYWVVRNAQWKAKYGTREKASKAWFEETYDKSRMQTISGADEFLQGDLEAGNAIMTHKLYYGPSAHRCMVNMIPLRKVGNLYPMKVVRSVRCHENCPVMGPQQEHETVQQYARDFTIRQDTQTAAGGSTA